MPQVIETVDEFIDRHGRDAIQIDRGATLIFSDGATMDGIAGRWRTEPPENEAKRLKLRQLYWKTKLEKDETAFVNLRASLHEQAQAAIKYSNMRPPQPADVETLKRLRDKVNASRAELAKVNETISETQQAKHDWLHDQLKAEREREIQNIANQIDTVTLDGEI